MRQEFVIKKVNSMNFSEIKDLKPDSREEFYGKASVLTGYDAQFLTGKNNPVLNIGEFILTRKDLIMILQYMEMK